MNDRQPWPWYTRAPATIGLAAAAIAVLAIDAVIHGTAEALARLLGRREHGEAEPWQPGDHDFCDLTGDEQATLAAMEAQLAAISSEDAEGAR